MLDFYQQLNLPKQATPKYIIDQAFLKKNEDTNLRQAWTVLRDPFFQDCYLEYGTSQLEKAGWFDHNCSFEEISTIENDYKILSTPLSKLQVAKTSSPIVLFTSGGFSPLHQGHIQMMESSKQYLTQKGLEVVGGYISVSHDDYVDTKYSEKISDMHRITFCQKKLLDNDWLMVDPWEALYAKTAINYTDVYLRLHKYLQRYYHPSVNICYVCGQDNSGFATCFIKQGMCSVVERSSQKSDGIELRLPSQAKIYFVSDNPYKDLSSNKLRNNNYLQQEDFKQHFDTDSKHNIYAVRMNALSASQKWIENKFADVKSINKFSEDCYSLITKALTTSLNWPETPTNLVFERLQPEKQLNIFNNKYLEKNIINIDSSTNHNHIKLDVSRLFHVADFQNNSHEIWIKKLEDIEAKEYILVDDDIITGNTIQRTKQYIEQKFSAKIIGIDSMLQKDVYDVVDLKDFLVGSFSGGLKIKADQQIFRAPYLAPFVNLYTRAKIPAQNITQLNIKLWQLNFDFFKQHPQITIKDCDPEFTSFAQYQGFNSSMPVYKYCQVHLSLFSRKNKIYNIF